MQIVFLFFLSMCLSLWGAQAQPGQTIDVHIANFESNDGAVYVALYDAEANWLEKRVRGENTAITNQEARVQFKNVMPGTYAISLFHDANNNKKLDTNFLGIPKEPIACSNNAVGWFGPPAWSDAKFEVKEELVELKISF